MSNKYLIILYILIGIFIVLFILDAQSNKLIYSIFVGIPLVFLLIISNNYYFKLTLIITAIFFPITIQFMGNDALTTATIFIFLLAAISFWKKDIFWGYKDKIVYLNHILIVIALIGVSKYIFSPYSGQIIRHFVNYFSSVVMFFIIINSHFFINKEISIYVHIDNIIKILVILVTIQVCLGILIKYYPGFTDFLQIFYIRNQEKLSGYISNFGVVNRLSVIIAGGEGLGEVLSISFPLFYYIAIKTKNILYYLCLIILVIGIILTGTRSSMILLAISVSLYIIFDKKIGRKFKFIFLFVLITIIILYIPGVTDTIYDRFEKTILLYNYNSNFVELMNRIAAWPQAWKTTMNSLSLFGHSPIQAFEIQARYAHINFHCLYLSLVFQYGIVGFIIFIYYFIILLNRMIKKLKIQYKNNRNSLLPFSLVLSLNIFLINEIKFEFNRGDSYQQFVFILFGLYYLVGVAYEKNINSN